ncbi:MAG: PKD domain-containing protein [Thermoplasmatota archaeon]
MKWNKKVSTILSLFFISSLMLLSFGYSVNTSSNDINSQNGLADSPWPRWRGNNQGTGLSPFNTSFVDGIEKWNLTLDGDVISSPVIGPDGTIYVASENESLYAVNPDGSLKWKENIEHSLYHPPTINKNGTLYFHLSFDKEKLYAYSEEGKQIWNITPESPHGNEGHFGFSPVINSNNTIFIEESGGLCAVDPNGTIKWTKYSSMGPMQLPPVMDSKGIIYFVTANGYLNAYYPNGTKKYEIGLPIPGGDYSPSFFVLSPVISPDNSINVIGGTSRSQYFVSVEPDGDIKHKKEQETSIFNQLALGPEENLYYGNGGFKSIYKNGTLRWSINLEGKTFRQGEWCEPAIGADGTIYVRTVNKTIGRFYGINPDGSIKWTISKNGNFTSPAIGSDGTIYVGNENGKLYALGPSSPEVNITSPKQKEFYKGSVTVEWEGSTVGSDIDHYEVKLDNESWTDVVKETSYKLDDLEEGKHVIKVKAVAQSGNYDIDSIEITVNKPPEINITAPIENEIFNTSTVTVEWNSNDVSGIDHHEVKINDDNWKDVGQSTEDTFEELSDGKHTVRIKAVDNTGNSTEKSVNFTVDTTPPTADAGEDIEVGISEQFTLDGTGSTDNTEIESFRWMINGEAYNKKVVNLSIDEIGEYTAELTVTDIAGNNGTDTITVSVVDKVDPTADAGEDRTVKVDGEVIFDASNSSDNVEITSYEWDFDDGTTATGKTVTHKFDEKGTYEVTLTVSDEAGNTDTDTVTVTVEKKDDNGAPGFTIGVIVLSITLILLYRRFR